MAFVIIALVGMYPARRIRWMLSRTILYQAPLLVAAIGCVAWARSWHISFTFHCMAAPALDFEVDFRFCIGRLRFHSECGLLAESSIPDHAMSQHLVISNLSYVVFIICFSSVCVLAITL